MNFCSACGDRVEWRIPDQDNRPRWCCPRCGTVHYQNPCMVVGTLPVWEDRILLCRRAIEPRYGLWTLPAGFLENGETTQDGAVRETTEEAGASIQVDGLYTVLDVIEAHQVHLYYRAKLTHLDFAPGPESLEVQLFAEAQIPWESLAFRTVAITLRHYFEDRARGNFGVHVGVVPPRQPR